MFSNAAQFKLFRVLYVTSSHPLNMLYFCTIFEVLCLLSFFEYSLSVDITASTFGSATNVMPATFGDFNLDELTDLFVISEDSHSVQIYLGSSQEPYFTTDISLKCKHDKRYTVTGITSGDFDGDALMDMMVTTRRAGEPDLSYVFVHWGQYNNSKNYLYCSEKYILISVDEPLVIAYRLNMITDLFGVDRNRRKVIWQFEKMRNHYKTIELSRNSDLKFPHSSAFLDFNDDNSPDLLLTGSNHYELWLSDNSSTTNFVHAKNISYPETMLNGLLIGQTVLLDLETMDKINPVVPLYQDDGRNSAVYAFVDGVWYNLGISFKDRKKYEWGFVTATLRYRDTVTLRPGDFNNDGYVDLLATLQNLNSKEFRVFLLENVVCGENCASKPSRTFRVRWDLLSPNNENTVMGTFFDFMQDGILDVIFVHFYGGTKTYNVSAYKNDLDYDANFIKIKVISEIINTHFKVADTSNLLGTRHFYGSNLPGPRVSYKTTIQDGNLQKGRSCQLPQSAHFPLHLPFTIFGLGRTPNFVEDLVIGMFNHSKQLSPIIPNSQLVVAIPNNSATNPPRWRAQLFVTPSKIIWQTVFALLGTCLVICIIITILYWKEKKEDKLEKLQESHKFHFDAM